MNRVTCDDLVSDVTEARAFLCGARACQFVLKLLRCPSVATHVEAVGGWSSVEAVVWTFQDPGLHKSSEHDHFVRLREVRDLLFVSFPFHLDPETYFLPTLLILLL